MRAHAFKGQRFLNIVIQGVFLFVRVKQIPGVANSSLNQLARFKRRVNRQLHIFQPVQAVKNSENVNPHVRGNLYEPNYYIVRVAFVPNRVGRAQKHLH